MRSIAAKVWMTILGMAAIGTALADDGGLLDNRVDVILREWSSRTGEIKSLYAEFTRTNIDHAWKDKEVAEGSARFLAPTQARLDVLGDNAESYILTGEGEIWEYKPPIKQITIYELPPEMIRGDAIQEGPLPFLFGTKPDKAKARYNFKIIEETDKHVHIKIKPKLQEDMKNFAAADLWLDRSNYLPSKLMFVEPNQNQVTYEFKGIWTNIEISKDDFVPKLIKGKPGEPDWRVNRKKVGPTNTAEPPRVGEKPSDAQQR